MFVWLFIQKHKFGLRFLMLLVLLETFWKPKLHSFYLGTLERRNLYFLFSVAWLVLIVSAVGNFLHK